MIDRSSITFRREFDQLLARARAKCTVAMGELLEVFREPLYKLASNTAPRQEKWATSPSDLVQEVMLKAIVRFPSFRGNTADEFHAWLQMILRNLRFDFLRAHNRQKREFHRELRLDSLSLEEREAFPDIASPDPCVSLIRATTSQEFKFCFAALSDSDQAIIRLHLFEKCSFSEIAHLLFISEDSARQRFFRARKRLVKLATSRGLDTD
jgi:RNA polymerase sigma-70 factor (ECF subfamily)